MRDSLFVVIGSGDFPVDMLHTARCYPAEREDVNILFNYSNRRTISLRGPIPNESLWTSKGWTVISREADTSENYNLYHTWPC